MSTVLIVILLLIGVFVAASVVLSRTTHEVRSAPDTEYLELEGDWIRYRVTGGGPPVVLVHGWLSSGRIWERLADRLAQRFTVYTLDLTGFGESDKPMSGYGVRYGSRLLFAFCAHFGLTRAAVVGHDVGGAMTVKLAADHPDVVGRIVLVATPAGEDQIDLPTFLWLATIPIIGPVFYTLGRFSRPLRRLWMRPFVLDQQDLAEEVVDDAGKSTPTAVTKTLDVMRREISRGRLLRQAGIVKAPVLAVAGEEDQIVDPQAANDWARTVSAEVVLLDGCGHLPMLERTGEFNARVLAFLTGDSRYLDTIAGAPEEVAREDEDITIKQTPEEPLASTEPEVPEPEVPEPEVPEPEVPEPEVPEPEVPEPETPGSRDPKAEAPNVVRKQDGRYPARSRDGEDAKDRPDGSSEASGDNGADEKSSRGHAGNGDEADEPVPEVPENLFEWPELKEPRPWDRSRETGRQDREERGEDADDGEDPEGPEERPPRS